MPQIDEMRQSLTVAGCSCIPGKQKLYLQRKHGMNQLRKVEVNVTRKLFKTGNSIVVSIPKDMQDYLSLSEGAEVELTLDRSHRQIVISPVPENDLPGVDETFATQVAEFIEQYRPALEALAK